MAIDAATIWELTDSGNAINGGGFADLNPGTSVDYSQQDDPEESWSDLAMTTGGTTLTSATGGFTAAMEGNVIRIEAGTHFVQGYYQVTGFNSSNSIEIDRDATDGSSASAGEGRLGGAISDITDDFMEAVVAGNRIWQKSGTYTLAENIEISSAGTNTLPIRWDGYGVERDDWPYNSRRPLIECGGYSFSLPAYWVLSHLSFQTAHANGLAITSAAVMLINIEVEQTAAGNDCIKIDNAGNMGVRLILCNIHNSAGSPTGNGVYCDGHQVVLDSCYIHDVGTGIKVDVNGINLITTSCILDTCANGYDLGADRPYIRWGTIYNCTKGIKGNVAENNHIRNTIIDTCTTGVEWTGAQIVFMDYNNWNGNGTDISGAGVTKGSHATAFDPLFTNAAAGNFALQAGSPVIQAGARIRVGVG